LAVPDPGIPTLATVLQGEETQTHLRLLAPVPWNFERLNDIRTRVIKLQKGNRCTLEIAFRTDGGWHYLIGKVYSRDRCDVFEAMQKIWQAGLNRDAEFSIPRPVTYIPSLRLLLQEKVEGVLAKRLLLDGNASQRFAVAERCALWLTRFQALAPQQGKIMDVQRILRHSERRVRFIVDANAPFADKARKLFQCLTVAPPTLERSAMCAGHGDYKHEHQFLLPEGSAVTFDWDCYDIADPCRDAALFVIYLKRLALSGLGSIWELDKTSQAFLKTYVAASQPGVAARLPFYKAALYLQEAKRDLGEQHPGWLERAEIMLDQGLRTLGQVNRGYQTCPN
jgi:hypothetical protein